MGAVAEVPSDQRGEWDSVLDHPFDPHLSYRPRVSVVIVGHRQDAEGQAMMREAEDSVYAQTYPLDDVDIVTKWCPQYWGHKFNDAIKAASGEWVLVLCYDDRLHPTYLAKAMAILRTLGDVEGMKREAVRSPALDCRPVDFVYSNIWSFGGPGQDFEIPLPDFSAESVRWACVPWMTMVARKAMLTRVRKRFGHVYDPKLQYLDWDLDRRLALMGVRGYRIPEPLHEARVHPENGHKQMNHYDAFVRMRHKHLFLNAPVPALPEEPMGAAAIDYGIPEHFMDSPEGVAQALAICNPHRVGV